MKLLSYSLTAFVLLAASVPVLLVYAQTDQSNTSSTNMTEQGGHHGFHRGAIIRDVIIAAIAGGGGYAGWRIYKSKKKNKDVPKDTSKDTM
jgi:hypothetical protein